MFLQWMISYTFNFTSSLAGAGLVLVLLSPLLLLALSLCGKSVTFGGVEVAARPVEILLGLGGKAIELILFCLAFFRASRPL